MTRMMRKILFFGLVLLISACNNEDTKLGDQYFKNGEYQKAVDSYTKYITLQPRNVKSLYNRGRAYEELGQYKKALEDFHAVIKEDPLNTNALLSITSDFYSRLHDYENTIFYADKVLKLDQNSALAHTLQGKSYQKLGKLKEAMAAYNAALSVNKEFVDAYLSRGSLRVYLKQTSKACSDFKLAASLNPEAASSLVKKYCK